MGKTYDEIMKVRKRAPDLFEALAKDDKTLIKHNKKDATC